ncbi:tetratricopeptide repeat protein [Streptomyces sp. NPDC005648]|uniref:phosphorylase family protein n=1 Tax=Streptomyces sp. NPDC005648 TaxID=3157044 RepID=UPI0033B3DD7D
MPATSPTVVALTALPLEYRALRAHLTGIEKHVHPVYGTRAEVGHLPGSRWRVALLETGEGTRGAAALTERVMSWFAPEAVLFVGVAGGLKADIELGDVVIATKVYAIHGGKESADGFLDRPETWHAPHHLEQAARHALRDEQHIRFKPIAAGEVLLADADSPLADRLRRRFDDAVAIEMEGSGVAHAAHLAGAPGALIIRGISDRADAGKSLADAHGSQRMAAARAAEAAVAVLRELEPRGSTALPPSEPSPSAVPGHGPVPTASTTLPPRPFGFTGRSKDLRRLRTHLVPVPDTTAAPPVLVCAVTGMGGIGKTALVTEAAHQACAKGWFPGGSLVVDLRGYDTDPVSADQALLALLDALGVRGPDLPNTTARQYDTYQEHLAEHRPRTLLILDNISAPDQFLRLLPVSGPHRVMVTSRDRPDSLPLHVVDLAPLPHDDSAALVTTALHNADDHDERPSLEPGPLRELTALCGHLPLALQIAAAMLRRRRERSIGTLVEEIKKAGDPTVVLDHGDRGTDQYGRPLALRPVLETSYRRLSPDRARLLRLLALVPGAEAGTEAVAALTDLDSAVAAGLLEDLSAAGLVTAVDAGGGVRWRLHDLVRAFGTGVAAGDAESRAEGRAGRERLLGYYLRWANAADVRLRWLPGKEEPRGFPDRALALAWLDAERAGLVAAVQWASEASDGRTAVKLAACLAEYLRWRRYFDDGITVALAAREAAGRTGDREGEADASTDLGLALAEAGRVEEAIDVHSRARGLYRAIGDRAGEGMAWNNLGTARREAGRADEAVVDHTCARNLFRIAGSRHGEGMAWNNLGNALREAGRVQEAVNAHLHALGLYQAVEDRHREGTAWHNLGNALGEIGRVQEALDAYGKALEICHEFQDWYGAGHALYNLARLYAATGRLAGSRDHYRRAAGAYERANAPTEASEALAQAAFLK